MQGFIFFCLSVSLDLGGKNLEKRKNGKGKREEGREKGKRKGNGEKGHKGREKRDRKEKGTEGRGLNHINKQNKKTVLEMLKKKKLWGVLEVNLFRAPKRSIILLK